MNNGWIKIHRKILEWEWYTDINTLSLFMHLLLICNFKKTKWRGIDLEIGETIKAVKTLSEETHLSVRNIRTAINHLKSTGEVTERRHGKHRILKLKKYIEYQVGDNDPDNEVTRKRQGSDKEVTLGEEGKNVKKEKNVKKYTCMVKKDFEMFWKIYPRKRGKKTTQKIFLGLRRKLLEEILKALKEQIASQQWEDKQYIPYPATWLNQERWKDEVEEREVPFSLTIS